MSNTKNQWSNDLVFEKNQQDKQILIQTNQREERMSKLTKSEMKRETWQQILRKYRGSLGHTKLENLNVMGNFLDWYHIQKLNQD